MIIWIYKVVTRRKCVLINLGKKIQFYRKEKALSQEALGKLLFVTRQTVSLWEKDQTLPSLDNIVRLAEIFGITVDELLSAKELSEPIGDAVIQSESDGDAEPTQCNASELSPSTESNEELCEKTGKKIHLSRKSKIFIICAATLVTFAVAFLSVVLSLDATLSDRRISTALSQDLPKYEKKVALNCSGELDGIVSITEITFAEDVSEKLDDYMDSEKPSVLSSMMTQSFVYLDGDLYCLYNEDLGERTISKFEATYILAVYYKDLHVLRVTEFRY